MVYGQEKPRNGLAGILQVRLIDIAALGGKGKYLSPACSSQYFIFWTLKSFFQKEEGKAVVEQENELSLYICCSHTDDPFSILLNAKPTLCFGHLLGYFHYSNYVVTHLLIKQSN